MLKYVYITNCPLIIWPEGPERLLVERQHKHCGACCVDYFDAKWTGKVLRTLNIELSTDSRSKKACCLFSLLFFLLFPTSIFHLPIWLFPPALTGISLQPSFNSFVWTWTSWSTVGLCLDQIGEVVGWRLFSPKAKAWKSQLQILRHACNSEEPSTSCFDCLWFHAKNKKSSKWIVKYYCTYHAW